MAALLPALLLAAVACIAYANALPNTLIYDDKPILDYQKFTDASSIPRYFTEHAWAARGIDSDLYRPMLSVSLILDANLFRDWFAGYHLVNVLLHAVATMLLYAFLSQLLARDPRTASAGPYAAMLAALVFAVSPANTEVVNSIFNRSIIMAAAGMLGGLWWLLRFLDSRPWLAWAGLFLAYSFALFCRETAIVLPGMAAILVFLYAEGAPTVRLRKILPVVALVIPLLLFLHLRSEALAPVMDDPGAVETAALGVVEQLDTGRLVEGKMLLRAAGANLQAIAVLLWPFDPKIYYSAPPLPLRWVAVVVHLGLFGLGVVLYARGHKGLIAGLAMFYLALLPSSRLVAGGDVPPHFSARYLYIAAAGGMVVLAHVLVLVQHRFDRLLAAAPVLLAVLVMTPATWARNTDWKDEITLFEAEYRRGDTNAYTLRLITGAYLKTSNFARVVEICDANREAMEQKSYSMFTVHCASALSYSGRHADAERAYLLAAQTTARPRMAYWNLGQHYLRQGRRDEGAKYLALAVDAETNPANKAYYSGYMLVQLYPTDADRWREARGHFVEALRVQPQHAAAREWLARVDRALGNVPESRQ